MSFLEDNGPNTSKLIGGSGITRPKTPELHALLNHNYNYSQARLHIQEQLEGMQQGHRFQTLEKRDSQYGATVLGLAVGNKRDNRIVYALIDEGANILAADTKGNTPLSWAQKHENTDLVDYMLHPERRDELRSAILTEQEIASMTAQQPQAGLFLADQVTSGVGSAVGLSS